MRLIPLLRFLSNKSFLSFSSSRNFSKPFFALPVLSSSLVSNCVPDDLLLKFRSLMFEIHLILNQIKQICNFFWLFSDFGLNATTRSRQSLSGFVGAIQWDK